MKKLGYMVLFGMALLCGGIAHANPPCPDRGNSLEAFAGCLVRVPGGSRLRKVSYAGGMDEANAAAFAATAGSSVIPPQPPTVGALGILSRNIFISAAYVHAARTGNLAGSFYYPFSPYVY